MQNKVNLRLLEILKSTLHLYSKLMDRAGLVLL